MTLYMNKLEQHKYKLRFLSYSTTIIIALVLVGCGLNDLNDKYSRFRSESCGHGVLVLNMVNSEFCCDNIIHRSEWVCLAAYDSTNGLMTSMRAFFIPLFPFFFTVLTDFLTVERGEWGESLKGALSRFKWSVALILYRTVPLIMNSSFYS